MYPHHEMDLQLTGYYYRPSWDCNMAQDVYWDLGNDGRGIDPQSQRQLWRDLFRLRSGWGEWGACRWIWTRFGFGRDSIPCKRWWWRHRTPCLTQGDDDWMMSEWWEELSLSYQKATSDFNMLERYSVICDTDSQKQRWEQYDAIHFLSIQSWTVRFPTKIQRCTGTKRAAVQFVNQDMYGIDETNQKDNCGEEYSLWQYPDSPCVECLHN